MRYTETNSSVSENGTPVWSVGDPGIPEKMSLSATCGKTFCSLLNRPCQFVLRPVVRTSLGRMAVDHSTV